MPEGYEPRFDLDYARGRQGELFVEAVRDAIQTERCEVKRDDRSVETGNVYVEYQCLRRGKWTKSGIATSRLSSGRSFWSAAS